MNKNAFKIEKERQRLAELGDFKKLKLLYDKKLPEIKDLNTSGFWDERYILGSDLKNQDPMTRSRIKIVNSFVPKGKANILDIGVGLGWIEESISKDKDKNIYGNDISPEVIKYLNKKFKGNFSVQSIYDLKYKENYFETVLALEVLEHIPPSKILKVLNSINKLLKKNGILIVSVPMNEGLESMKDNINGHVRMYTEKLIIAELELTGFKPQLNKTLYAFNKNYELKSIYARTFKTHKPNNIVIKAVKI